MVLFQSKIDKRKIIVPFRSYQPRNRKFQKNSRKIKTNTIMASFQAKTCWKRPRKREKIKIIDPFRSYSTRNREFQKNRKKIQKIKKHHYHFFSSPNKLGNIEKERKLKN